MIGVLDQGLSVLSNMLVAVAVARTLDPAAFGSFALAQMVYSSILLVMRSLIAEPYVVLTAGNRESHADYRWVRLVFLGAAIGAAVGLSLFALLASSTGWPPVDASLVLVFMPLLIAQDLLRWVAIAGNRQVWALYSDAIWAFVMGAWVLGFGDRLPSVSPALAWIIGCACGTIMLSFLILRSAMRTGSRPLAGGPHPSLTRAVLRQGAPGAGESALGATGLQIGFYAAAAVVGPAVIADSRGALLLLGPLGVITSGLLQWLLPRFSTTLGSIQGLMLRVQSVIFALAMIAGVLIYYMPTGLAVALLGDTWHGAKSAIPAMTIYTGFVLVLMVAQAGVRARHESRRLYRLRRFDVVLIPVILSGGAALGRDQFFWAIAATGMIDAAMAMATLATASKGRRSNQRPGDDDELRILRIP